MSQDTPLPTGWETRTSRSTGMSYYLNVNTKKAQWEHPLNPAEPPDNIRCSHILVKHAESRRPNSWREHDITRSKMEALEVIKRYRKEIVMKEKEFVDVALKYSDCSSARHCGDLGMFGREDVGKMFRDEAFKLKVGQLSRPFETVSGYHIVVRTM